MNLSTFVFASVALTIQLYVEKYSREDLDSTLQDLQSELNLPRIRLFDFIIVGGGSAGCVLAARLSEKFTVLLLESGGDPVPATYNPYLYPFYQAHPAINNIFVSVPQTNFTQQNGGIVRSSSGRTLGGSGSHSGNLYFRGSPHDYDNFANLTGDPSWAYENVLELFKRFESMRGPLVQEEQRQEYYGGGGPFKVETDWTPILEGWFQSARELGYQIGDANGFQEEGFTPVVKSIKNEARFSSYLAYLKPILPFRRTLKVLRYSTAQRILIDENNRAYGVAYLRHGIPQIAHASKEVVISCGTFQTPLLLIKSGIGPLNVLQSAQIPIKSALEGVGKNFRNQPFVILNFTLSRRNVTLLPDAGSIQEELFAYQQTKRSGIFGQQNGPIALIVSSRAKLEGQNNWPDIQILFRRPQTLLGISPDTLRISVALTRPKSAGEIGLNSDSYLQGELEDTRLANVDFRQLTVPGDADVIIEGIKIVLSIMENTTTFTSMGVQYADVVPEACLNFPFRSDPYWRCYVEQTASVLSQYAGTCKMGNDENSVVNSKLRVHNIRNLRVVDASVLPLTTNTNINGAVLLVAEKAVGDILADYGVWMGE